MKLGKPLVLSAGAILIMLAAAVWAWPRTPELLPVHFGLNGEPDRMGSRAEAFLMLPAVAVGITLLFGVLPRVMPRNSRLERSGQAYGVVWLGAVGLMTVLQLAMILRAVGAPVDMTQIIVAGVGVLFALIGNFMGKMRYNYVMGVRTPWTLSSEAVWDRTHRATAPWVMAGGLLLIGMALVSMVLRTPPALLFAALIALTVGPMLGGAAYSYVVYRRLEGGGAAEG